MSWLHKDLLRVGGFRLKVHHLLFTIVLCVVVFLIGLLAGWWYGAYEYPYRTLPKPPLPKNQKAPNPQNCPHTMGGCLPKPASENAASITASSQGPDFSNNNPVYGVTAWSKIAGKSAFAIFKVTEGAGYVDPTAGAMVSAAKAHGLTVGGYDFLHVCGDSASAEATTFVWHLKADGLTGAHTFPGIADAEYGGNGCDARAWLNTWTATVKAQTGRTPMVYTGAWWWQPHLGAYWPGSSLSWVSGYGVRYPFMPSGRSQLDLWQFSDNGFNGYNAADLSQWRDGAAAFGSLTGTSAPKPAATTAEHLERFDSVQRTFGKAKARERATIATWDKARCANPVRRAVCKSSAGHLKLLRGRLLGMHAHGKSWGYGKPTAIGARNQQFWHRLSKKGPITTWATGA